MASSAPDELDLWIHDLGAFFRSPIRTVGIQFFQLGLTSSKWAIRVLILALALSLCVFVASLVFAWIYFTMMPIKHLERPIYFDFSKSSPEALVSLVGNQWHYKTPIPYNLQPITTFLTSGVPYDVDVEFTVASQVVSSQSGMIMIEATAEHAFRDKTQTVAHSKRPIEFTKIPFAIQFIRDSFMLVPMLVGLYSSSFRVKTRIFERFADYQQFPISTMNLTLIRAPTNRGEIHLTNAALKFSLHLSGWRFLFYSYFWTSAIILVPVLAIVLFLIAMGGYFTMTTKATTPTQPATDFQIEEEETISGYESMPTSPLPSPSRHRPDSERTSPFSSEDGLFDSTLHSPPKKELNVDNDELQKDLLMTDHADVVNRAVKKGTLMEHEAKYPEEDRLSVNREHFFSDFEQIPNDIEDEITVSSFSENGKATRSSNE